MSTTSIDTNRIDLLHLPLAKDNWRNLAFISIAKARQIYIGANPYLKHLFLKLQAIVSFSMISKVPILTFEQERVIGIGGHTYFRVSSVGRGGSGTKFEEGTYFI